MHFWYSTAGHFRPDQRESVLNKHKPTERKAAANRISYLASSAQHKWARERGTKALSVFVPTCMLVVGWSLWFRGTAAPLEEEGGSFDHEEALTEAKKGEGANESQCS